ncbi:MAG: HAD family hydrolase [Acetobacter sp.]|nr:HAD family hydrolase [Bacteroides sp.]MCM1341492.1 HAD family hydrolase [Acetobacter sp.]MCM1433720.1 HAD family hydrolase [Clostridiales bacterium]
MNNIKWLFFDLGATLINEDDAHKQRIINTVNLNSGITYDDLYNEMIKASRSFMQPYPTAVKALALSNISKYPKELERLYEDTYDILKYLHKKYKIGIIANQLKGSEERIKNWEIDCFIDAVFASAELRIAKPDVRIFKYALSETDASPQESVMIGDRIDNDILPAKSLGMKTVWIKQGFGKYQEIISDSCNPDFVISNLNELKTIL